MNSIFNYENKFFAVISKIVDCFYASILWLIFCIPIVTIGASTTALYYTVHKSIRGNRAYVWKCFWGAFKENFAQTTKIWLIMLVVGIFLFLDTRITKSMWDQSKVLGSFYYFFYFLMFFEAVWAIFTFAYSARFANGLKETMKNAAIMAVVHLPWALAVLGIFVAAIVVIYVSPFMGALLPAVVCIVYDRILEKIFRKYMSEEDLKLEQEIDYGNHD